MANDRTSAAGRARLRARVAACLLADAGDTLIEVTIAALLVALIAVATFTGYTGVSQIAATEKYRSQADSLAQQDEARLRGLSLTALAGSGSGTGTGTGTGTGNYSYTQTVDNTVYTITSASRFVSGSGGTQSCTSSGTSTADEVQTTSTVAWGTGSHNQVVVNGLVAPQQGGSLIARAMNSSGALSGVTITLSGGPTSVSPLVTDVSGCTVFGGLAGGTYTVTATDSGYVSASTTATVVPTTTAATTFTLAEAG